MAQARRDWTQEETMMAFVLYLKLPPKDYRATNEEVIRLANAIGRAPGAVKAKMENLKRGDENRIKLGQSGLTNGARLELVMWERFREEGDVFLEKALNIFSKRMNEQYDTTEVKYSALSLPPEGKTRVSERVERVNQQYFRNSLLQNYQEKCCLTGLATPKLLVASHIKPWAVSDPKTERLVASNGLLLNALHDRAFDQGLMTLNKNLEVVLSPALKHDSAADDFLFKFEGQRICEPKSMPPAKEFIEYHNDVIFVRKAS